MIHVADAARKALEDMLDEMVERLEAMSEGDPERPALARLIASLEDAVGHCGTPQCYT